MGCFPFANSRFQMGVTVMGFAEDFGQYEQLQFDKPSIIEFDMLIYKRLAIN